jgi:low temperature requirement protein LtrA
VSSPSGSESVIPDSPYIRTRDGREQHATYFELFFDLVYVFAITQLSHHLLGDLTWEGAAQTALLLLAVYWAWNYTTWMTNWFDPETGPVRLLLAFVMLASLLMAVAIPQAFAGEALLFAASYCALQIGRNAFVVAVTPSGAFRENFVRIGAWALASTPLWIGGGIADGDLRWVLWLAALGLDLLAPLATYWVPGMGTAPAREWQIDPGHFSERFQLFIIIVLGESIVITGATASGTALGAENLIALSLAFVISVALWWLYFGQIAARAVSRIASAEVPGRLGRNAYTYLHIPIVAGILLTAVGDELLVAHPGHHLGDAGALVTLAGPALYLLGLFGFGALVGRRQNRTQLAVAALLLAAVPLAAGVSALCVAAVEAAILVALVVADRQPG